MGLIDSRLERLRQCEAQRFAACTSRSRALWQANRAHMPCGVPMSWMQGLYRHTPLTVRRGAGAWFEDVDGHRYLDMNQADLFASLGFAPPPVVRAVQRRVADGSAFLLPTEDAQAAAALLAQRTGLPYWQFSGSASAANCEAIRLARLATGRDGIVVFDGKYHGHLDETLVTDHGGGPEPELIGLDRRGARATRIVPFNDLGALRRALSGDDIACVLAEPMLTNCNLVFPAAGYWPQARSLIRAAGALLIADEAHTFLFAHGGLAPAWGLDPDLVVLGKGLGSGIPFGAYGMTEPLARAMERHLDIDVGEAGLASGGTTYASAVVLAVARAVLEECLTPEAYGRVGALGERLGGGLEAAFTRRDFDWRAPRIGGRSGWVLFPQLPRDAAESRRSLDPLFVDTRRLFLANRGIWEAIATAGPACSFSHRETDVDRYLAVADEFLAELAS